MDQPKPSQLVLSLKMLTASATAYHRRHRGTKSTLGAGAKNAPPGPRQKTHPKDRGLKRTPGAGADCQPRRLPHITKKKGGRWCRRPMVLACFRVLFCGNLCKKEFKRHRHRHQRHAFFSWKISNFLCKKCQTRQGTEPHPCKCGTLETNSQIPCPRRGVYPSPTPLQWVRARKLLAGQSSPPCWPQVGSMLARVGPMLAL